jgi:hypothetical protein
MKIFHCSHCRSQVFFENSSCLHCGHSLAYLPDREQMAAFRTTKADDVIALGTARGRYRLCDNYRQGRCNWAVPAADPDRLCASCRLTRRSPTAAEQQAAWTKLETSKRRLIYSLLQLRLPVAPKSKAHPQGVCFDFLADTDAGDHRQRITTGHDNGVITINLDEADDVRREIERTRQGEPYRTLVGHFRHEIGHYYWDQLIGRSDRLKAFRATFGDERADYGRALKRHYAKGAPFDWQERYISAYASAHPWEDWAECWAHVLHVIDALESAAGAGLGLSPGASGVPRLRPMQPSVELELSFDELIERWTAVASVMNSLNRSLGLPDSYPFVLTKIVRGKLRFIYELLQSLQRAGADSDRVRLAPWLAVTGVAAAFVALGLTVDRSGLTSD